MLDIIKWGLVNIKKYGKKLFALGILLCSAGAGLLFNGIILGETTTNVATVLVITGMGLIATQRRAMNDGGE
ncbi:MAG: hypothetical protein JSV51_03655 [Candidatus Bathyarchaeota archaeon]|nr:MAG: hypothetical protein JSV51_03655 [Candidatus Bathyarchaeota archaeon]